MEGIFPNSISLEVGNKSRASPGVGASAKGGTKLEGSRTSRNTQKLVVFPEAETGKDESAFIEQSICEYNQPFDEKVADDDLRRVSAYLTAESYDIQAILQLDSKNPLKGVGTMKRFDEVLYAPYNFDYSLPNLEMAVASSSNIGEIFLFEYGVIVIWGLEEAEEANIIRSFKPFEVSSLASGEQETETFAFSQNPLKPPRLFNDVINLHSGNSLVKLTISHSFAQSVKLTYFEELIENSIIKTKSIPYELSLTGTIKMSRKNINMQIGELFAMRMNVNLISNVLDTPDIFWSYPSLNPLYRSVRGYLEISHRIEVLNQRCAVISDMLDMLRDHANIMHGESLEWIIILLIAFEIFIGLIKAIL